MFCRICGRDNKGRDSGKCENCGFELSNQNQPSKEKRSALQERSTEPVNFDEKSEFKVPMHKKQARIISIVIVLVGVIIALTATLSLESPYYEPPPPERESFESQVVEIPIDPIAELVGSDIVYLMSPSNDTTITALPRASIDMAAIPNGSSVSFLGGANQSLRATFIYILDKIDGRDFDQLNIDRLAIWTDSTETQVRSVSLARIEETESDSVPGPLTVKIYFTPRMLRAKIDEWNQQKSIPITRGSFRDSELEQISSWIPDRISRRDIEGREVQVVALFDYNAYNYGEIVDLLIRLEPSVIDSLGYSGFVVNVFAIN